MIAADQSIYRVASGCCIDRKVQKTCSEIFSRGVLNLDIETDDTIYVCHIESTEKCGHHFDYH